VHGEHARPALVRHPARRVDRGRHAAGREKLLELPGALRFRFRVHVGIAGIVDEDVEPPARGFP
jgi:hypothetical protein